MRPGEAAGGAGDPFSVLPASCRRNGATRDRMDLPARYAFSAVR
jgi:hypothetical protein